ncbi:MAG TPA: UrcA family protein [Allosphingosinicella sp.]|jgi:UrcA family protein|nr:UrcA family protein [Allosphingosinicella sp.]
MKMRYIICGLAAIAANAGTPASAAQPAQVTAGEAFRVTIESNDLDLGTRDGREALLARFRAAARAACGAAATLSAYDHSNLIECRRPFELALHAALREHSNRVEMARASRAIAAGR